MTTGGLDMVRMGILAFSLRTMSNSTIEFESLRSAGRLG